MAEKGVDNSVQDNDVANSAKILLIQSMPNGEPIDKLMPKACN